MEGGEEDNLCMFSPERMSPPTKRVSQKTTPAMDRFKPVVTKLHDSSDEDSQESSGEVVTKTPRPKRRGATAKVSYKAMLDGSDEDSQGYSDGDESDSDDEFE
ncbi:unnamed protein product [Choristocarpus tenellus]